MLQVKGHGHGQRPVFQLEQQQQPGMLQARGGVMQEVQRKRRRQEELIREQSPGPC